MFTKYYDGCVHCIGLRQADFDYELLDSDTRASRRAAQEAIFQQKTQDAEGQWTEEVHEACIAQINTDKVAFTLSGVTAPATPPDLPVPVYSLETIVIY
jgi:hypothetical protein